MKNSNLIESAFTGKCTTKDTKREGAAFTIVFWGSVVFCAGSVIALIGWAM